MSVSLLGLDEGSRSDRSEASRRDGSAAVPCGSIVVARDFNALERILEPDVCVVVVRRSTLRWSALRLPSQSPSGGKRGPAYPAEQLSRDQVPADLADRIAEDEARLAPALRCLYRGVLRRELLVVPGDECRKFHVDFYPLRALVTYVGEGTWLAPREVVDPSFLCAGGDDVEVANTRIVKDPLAIVRALPGDVVLLKGAHFGHGSGGVHRSPPRVPRRPRLLLKLTLTTSVTERD
jgi:hypothetical protein